MKKEQFNKALDLLVRSDCIRNDGQGSVFGYDEKSGVWNRLDSLHARQFMERILAPHSFHANTAELKEIYQNVAERCDFIEEKLASDEARTFVVCQNGVVNLMDGNIIPSDKTGYYKRSLNFNYSKDAKIQGNSETYKYLQTLLGVTGKLEDSPKFKLLLQIILYGIADLKNAKKAVILLGPAGIGKSILLSLIEKLVGDCYCTWLTWGELSKEDHVSLIKNKTLILSDEMPCTPLRHLDRIKSIISGNPIVLNKKYGEIGDYRPHVKLISAANNMPSLGEPDVKGAFAERLLVLPLGKVPSEDKDPDLLDKLWKEKDQLFSMALSVAPEFIRNNLKFYEDAEGVRICEQFSREGFSISAYIEAGYHDDPNGRVCLQEFYDGYVKFCEDGFLNGVTKTEFKSQLIQLGYDFKKARDKEYYSSVSSVSCVIGISRGKDESCQSKVTSQQK